MVDYITEEQARIVEEKHYKKYKGVVSFLENNFNISSIKEFIIKIDELPIDDELFKKLTIFKNELQSKINDKLPRALLYYAIKNYITDKRLELLNKIKDEGLLKCMEEYSYWRILDTILNTKWRYEYKAFNYNNPIVDKFNDVVYKNVKEASQECGVSEDYIKSNFGYDKRWMYISYFFQFRDKLPIEVRYRNSYRIRVYNNITHASRELKIPVKNIRYYSKEGGYFKDKSFRHVSLHEFFIRLIPVIVEDGEEKFRYSNILDASSCYDMNKAELKDYIDSGKSFKYKSKMYYARFVCDIDASKDKVMKFEEDKEYAKEIYKKIKELRNKYSLSYLFKISSPAA